MDAFKLYITGANVLTSSKVRLGQQTFKWLGSEAMGVETYLFLHTVSKENGTVKADAEAVYDFLAGTPVCLGGVKIELALMQCEKTFCLPLFPASQG